MAHQPSAFPVNAANLGGSGAYAADPGMDLRDWFAGQIVGGMMAAPSGGREWVAAAKKLGVEPDAAMARGAYTMAEAMLAERERLTLTEFGAAMVANAVQA